MSLPSASPLLPVSPSEAARLRELHSLGVLRTPAEELYDGLAEIAAALMETPIALVTLIGAEEQWFKAKVGVELCTNPREASFCTHTILGSRVLAVEDAALDPRFRRLPTVAHKPFVRSYAGAPLITDAGEAVGTLCVLDLVPRRFSPEQLRNLERLARQAVSLMEGQRRLDQFYDHSLAR